MNEFWEEKKKIVQPLLDNVGVGLKFEIKREHFPDRGLDLTWFYVNALGKCVSVMIPTVSFMGWDGEKIKDNVLGRTILSLCVEELSAEVRDCDGSFTYTFNASDFKEFSGV